jgi:hypothetical protein
MKPIWYFLFGVWAVAPVFLLAAWWPFLASSIRRRFLRDRRPELILALEELEKAKQRVAKMHSAFSRWWGYYITGYCLIESKVVRAFWGFAHRKGCVDFMASSDWELVRKELIRDEVSPLTDKIRLSVMHFQQVMLASADLWYVAEWDYRMRCRKCGRVHQRTITQYQPL